MASAAYPHASRAAPATRLFVEPITRSANIPPGESADIRQPVKHSDEEQRRRLTKIVTVVQIQNKQRQRRSKRKPLKALHDAEQDQGTICPTGRVAHTLLPFVSGKAFHGASRHRQRERAQAPILRLLLSCPCGRPWAQRRLLGVSRPPGATVAGCAMRLLAAENHWRTTSTYDRKCLQSTIICKHF